MPPLGRARVDLTGVALLTEWIAAMDEDCGVAE
jgi:ABC-type transporter Mla MlaB component